MWPRIRAECPKCKCSGLHRLAGLTGHLPKLRAKDLLQHVHFRAPGYVASYSGSGMHVQLDDSLYHPKLDQTRGNIKDLPHALLAPLLFLLIFAICMIMDRKRAASTRPHALHIGFRIAASGMYTCGIKYIYICACRCGPKPILKL